MSPAQFKTHLANPALPSYCRTLDHDCPLDRWISYAVKVLRDAGVETYESCQGGPGHSYADPTVRFHGQQGDGFKAVSVALTYGLPALKLSRMWTLLDGEPVGPYWELTFSRTALVRIQRKAERCGLIS